MGDEPLKSKEAGTDLNVPLVPLVSGTLPVAAQIISPMAFEALAKESPDQLLKFVESYDERQLRFYSLKEENKHRQQIEQEKTKRFGMGLIFATIASVMIYSGLTGDKTLSEKIINVAIGALGGLGAGAVFLQKKSEG